jgi:hypothetical protein
MEAWMQAAGMAIPAPGQPADEWQGEGYFDEEDPAYAYTGDAGEEIPAPGLERHNRRTALLKPRRAWTAYREMLRYYAVKTLMAYLEGRPDCSFDALAGTGGRVTEWVNLGGQIVPAFRVDGLRAQIREGKAESWDAIHRAYDDFWAAYPLDKARHAWGVFTYLQGGPVSTGAFMGELDRALETRRRIAEQVYRSRAKDFNDPFRGITYRNREEMDRVAGKAEDNFFVNLTRGELARFEERVRGLRERIFR